MNPFEVRMIYDPSVPLPQPAPRNVAQLIPEKDRRARILVVDDDASNLNVLTRILQRAGFTNVVGIRESRAIKETVLSVNPDLVMLDMHMPGANGIDLIAEIGACAGPSNYLPVLVVTGDASESTRDAALTAGARDFITKPYQTTEVVLRVRNLIETRLLHVQLQRQNDTLARSFAARTQELDAARLELLDRLARASDFRDESTHAHTERVGELSACIARRLGMGESEADQLQIAARLHDIGKIGVSDSVLMKAGPLTEAEFDDQVRHTLIGGKILSGSQFPTLRMAEQVALTHHEAWDGTGYPNQLRGEEIPLAGRIVAVADVFDALTHERPYKQPWEVDAAVEEIVRQRGQKFDPAVVDAFLDVVLFYVADKQREAHSSARAVAKSQHDAVLIHI
ncbi:MAG TPA: HD domain-containing phosphohydrolase [Longimicrobiales bacterium]